MSTLAEPNAHLAGIGPTHTRDTEAAAPTPVDSRALPFRLASIHLAGPLAAILVVLLVPAHVSPGAALLVLGSLAVTWSALLARAEQQRPLLSSGLGLRRLALAGLELAVLGSAVLWWVLPSFPGWLLLGIVVAMIGAVWVAEAASARLAAAPMRRALVVGPPEQVTELTEELLRGGEINVVGCCHLNPLEVLHAADTSGAEIVVVQPTADVDTAALRRLGWQLAAQGRELMVVTRLIGVDPRRADVETLGDACMVRVRRSELHSVRRTVHHFVGRALAAVMLVALAPLLAVLFLAVRLDSPGPALFRQRRVGRHGVEFTMLKLRTMTHQAHQLRDDLDSEGDGLLFKMRRDPRVTRIGVVLRRYSLDELPQLINVVRGEMALVGPRPALPEEVAQYGPDVRRRLAVLPGLTGLWQVSGRSDLSWDDTVRLDLHYVDNWRPSSDLEILARTASAVVPHRGAY